MVTAAGNQNINANAAGGRALSSGELKMMLGQCLKMASENKITPHNTWGLPLIEHLDDLIKEEDPTQHTNFQRASVTLDAGVKIYSYRVDSVHTETFKMLGGLGRASGPEEDQENSEPGQGTNDTNSPSKKKRRHGDLNPDATLEPSFEALNVKKFDLAFAVDPLFHKTSAQFDEGGAKGLLLNNLNVFRGCEIVFDSMDIPEKALDMAAFSSDIALSATVSLDSIASQVRSLKELNSNERISPTIDEILEQLTGSAPPSTAQQDTEAFVQRVVKASSSMGLGGSMGSNAWMGERAPSPECQDGGEGTPGMGHDGMGDDADLFGCGEFLQDAAENAQPYGESEEYDDGGADYGGYDDGDVGGSYDDETSIMHRGHEESLLTRTTSNLDEDAISWLISAGNNGTGDGSGYVTAAKGWAGPSHWRYRALPQGMQRNGEKEGDDADPDGIKKSKKRSAKRHNEPTDFVAAMQRVSSDGAVRQQQQQPVFEVMPTSKTRRKTTRTVAKTLLPEDHHYLPETLARYALRPRNFVTVPGERRAEGVTGFADASGGFQAVADNEFAEQRDEGEDYYYGDGGGECDWGAFDQGGDGAMEMEGSGAGGDGLELVDAARRVEKVEVNYSRAAKQVDVKSLKELMWSGMHAALAERVKKGISKEEPLEFAEILATVPEANAAGRLEDLSVHLCFICVLHLANEHGLVIRGVSELDALRVSNIPAVAA